MARPRTNPDTPLNNYRRIRDLQDYYGHDPMIGWAKTALANARARAKRKNLCCTITLDDVLHAAQGVTHCAILHVPLTYGRGHGKPFDHCASIDRIDNDAGYTPETIAVISRRANAIKGNCSLDEMMAIGEYALSARKQDN